MANPGVKSPAAWRSEKGFRLFVILTASIALAEAIIMRLLQLFTVTSPLIEMLMDTVLLTLVVGPLTYFLFYKELLKDIAARAETEENLRALTGSLEEQVRVRTTKLLSSNAEIHSILESTADGILRIDTKGAIQTANRAAHRILGYRGMELVGQNISAIIPEAHLKVLVEGYIAFLGGWAGDAVTDTIDAAAIKKGGGVISVEITISECIIDQKIYYVLIMRDTTERRKTTDLLVTHEKALSAAQSIAHLGSWEMDIQNGKITCSDELYRIYGFAPGAGEPTFNMFMGFVHPEDRKIIEDRIPDILSGKIPRLEFDVRIIRPDGQERVLHDMFEVIFGPDGTPVKLAGINLDITERKAVEKAMRHSEERFRALTENQSDLVFVVDENNNYTYISPSVQRILGYTPEEMIRTKFELIHPDDVDAILKATRKAQENPGMPICLEIRYRHRNGNWMTFSSTGTSFQKNPAIHGIIVNLHDITERKVAEDKLKAAKEEAEAATVLKDKFVSLVSHDLKGPLGAMLGFMQIIQNKEFEHLSPISREGLKHGIESGWKMSALIDDLLNLGRVRTGKIAPHFRFFDAYSAANKAMAQIGQFAAQKEITIKNQVPRGSRMFADETLIAEVFYNLLSNAIKFSRMGDTVTVFMIAGSPPTIGVADSGTGIPPNRVENLFSYEKKTSTPGTNRETGSGLGLPLSNEIVAAHGGTLTLKTEPGKGSTFFVTLPLNQRPHILVVDDEPAERELLKQRLAPLESDLLEAHDGDEALRLLRGGERIDLVVSNIWMPVVNGMELVMRMKEDKKLRHIPVIMLTSDSSMDTREKALGLGADDFSTKPVDPNDLLPRIRRFIG